MGVAYVDELSAWRSSAGAFIANFALIGLIKSVGILLIALEEILELNTMVVILTPITNSAATGILSPLGEFLAQFLTYRGLVCVGGLIFCLTFTLSSFFLNSTSFYPLLGLCVGFGISLSYCSTISVTGLCFEKRRTTAIGVCFAGASVGSMLMPVLVTFLLDIFPVRSVLLVFGAIMLNVCVAGVLLPTKIVDTSSGRVVLDQHVICCHMDSPNNREAQSVRKQNRTKRSEPFLRVFLRALPFLIPVLLANFSHVTQLFAITLFAGEFHCSRYFIAGFLTVQGVVDLIMRIVSGIVGDKFDKKQKFWLWGGAVIVQGVMALTLGLLPFQAKFMIYSVGYASAGAVYMTLWTVVLMTVVGRQNFSLLLSIFYMAMGLFNLPMGLVISWIKDISGSYHSVIFLCATLQAISGTAWLVISAFWLKQVMAPEANQTPPFSEKSEMEELNS